MSIEETFAEASDQLLSRAPDVVPPDPGGTGFSSATLRVGGRIFAMLVNADVVVKLPRARVDELVAQGGGRPFTGSGGRVMKEWVRIEPADVAACVASFEEALAFVRGTTR